MASRECIQNGPFAVRGRGCNRKRFVCLIPVELLGQICHGADWSAQQVRFLTAGSGATSWNCTELVPFTRFSRATMNLMAPSMLKANRTAESGLGGYERNRDHEVIVGVAGF